MAVSMFSPEVSALEPRNLLIISGEWEGTLRSEAERVTTLFAGTAAAEGETYTILDKLNRRRAVIAPNAEHVSVLYSQTSLREATLWLAETFGSPTDLDVMRTDRRAPWILVLVVSLVALGWPLTGSLPRTYNRLPSKSLSLRTAALILLIPTVATPLLLWPVPKGSFPVLVADYLALHFALFGIVALSVLYWRGASVSPGLRSRPPQRFLQHCSAARRWPFRSTAM